MSGIRFLTAASYLIGTTIGAGIFALPFAFSQSGLLPSLAGLGLAGLFVLIVNLAFARITLATSDIHHLPGFAHLYLGKVGGLVSLIFLWFSLNGALLAYTLLAGDFLALLLPQLPHFLLSLLFVAVASQLFLTGAKKSSKITSGLTLLLILLAVGLPLWLARFWQKENLAFAGTNPCAFWGPTIFALTGFSVIPEMEAILGNGNRLLYPAVALGTLVPLLIYFLFGFGIWGITGAATTQDALAGLVEFSTPAAKVGAVLGILAITTSFLGLAEALKEIYHHDLRLKDNIAQLLALFPAFAGLIIPTYKFVTVLEITGKIGITGSMIIILAIWRKLNHQKDKRLQRRIITGRL